VKLRLWIAERRGDRVLLYPTECMEVPDGAAEALLRTELPFERCSEGVRA
jgi:hypothetical protein